ARSGRCPNRLLTYAFSTYVPASPIGAIRSRPKGSHLCLKRGHEKLPLWILLIQGARTRGSNEVSLYCSASPCCEMSSPSNSCWSETRSGTNTPTTFSSTKVTAPDHSNVTATP